MLLSRNAIDIGNILTVSIAVIVGKLGQPLQNLTPPIGVPRVTLGHERLMPDWSAMFVPELSLLEVIARGTIMYLFLFLVMRFLLKREGGRVSIADILVVVAVVDGA